MAAATRIYTVLHVESGTRRLVRATHPAVAINHVATAAYSASVSSQDDLVELLTAGKRVEIAGEAEPGASAGAGAPADSVGADDSSSDQAAAASTGSTGSTAISEAQISSPSAPAWPFPTEREAGAPAQAPQASLIPLASGRRSRGAA